MKYDIKTFVTADSKIVQITSFNEVYKEVDTMTDIMRSVMDTNEQQVIDALISLGWTPPKIN